MATLADVLRQTGYAQDGTLAAPATDSPMTRALSEHIKTLPQQLATNQAALDSAIGSWNKTDFGTGQPNPNYRPEAIAELTQLMPNIGGLTAWHGTPHKIQGAFDISKVGTGEGAQAYGHGIYFAENPGVAKQYQKDLANHYEPYVQYGKDKVSGQGLSDTDLNVFKYLETGKKYAGEFPHNTQYYAKKVAEEAGDLEALKKLQEHSDIKFGEQFNAGNLYKVDIPDEHIPNMLDWDKPLNQQNSSVLSSIKIPQKAADRYNEISNKLEELQWTKGGLDSPEWNKLFEEAKDIKAKYGLHRSGEELYREVYKVAEKAGAANPSQAAAESLKAQGISGIRYLDEGSRSAGKGTSNFVVFDPSTVKILEENSKPISRKALIEEQVNKLKD